MCVSTQGMRTFETVERRKMCVLGMEEKKKKIYLFPSCFLVMSPLLLLGGDLKTIRRLSYLLPLLLLVLLLLMLLRRQLSLLLQEEEEERLIQLSSEFCLILSRLVNLGLSSLQMSVAAEFFSSFFVSFFLFLLFLRSERSFSTMLPGESVVSKAKFLAL